MSDQEEEPLEVVELAVHLQPAHDARERVQLLTQQPRLGLPLGTLAAELIAGHRLDHLVHLCDISTLATTSRGRDCHHGRLSSL